MKIGSLFSGYEGLGIAVQSVLGGDIAWVSDIDPGACKILAHRYPDVPNLGDITTVDWSAVEPVDVLTGGFPCTDVSCAGLRQGLTPDTRSGLWSQMAVAIDKLRPPLVVIENVRGLLSASAEHPAHSDLEPCPWCVGDGGSPALRALGAVLGDLADIGYDASWQGLRAADVGAPHGRFRVFVAAWPAPDAGGLRGERRRGHGELAGPSGASEAHRGERERHGDAIDDRRAVAQDPDLATRGERRLAASGQTEGGRARADARGRDRTPAADADRAGLEGRHAHPERGGERPARAHRVVDWGPYELAVRRWERLTRPAPAPTEQGRTGARLSPAFVEWMQGLPAGWVTDVPGLTRNEMLKALGNGVCPPQAAQALQLLLPDVLGVAA